MSGAHARLRHAEHPRCVFCGPHAPPWPALAFQPVADGGVAADFPCAAACEGYPDLMHGGIAAGLLDAAMTNALFATGIAARTGRMTVRYHRPLRPGQPARVAGRVAEQRGAWWVVRGAITQDGALAVSAEAWFSRDAEADPG